METTTPTQDSFSTRNIPSTAIQADRQEWLSQILKGEQGDARLLLSGLRQSDADRWRIGIEDAWLSPGDPTKIVLKLLKPKSHPREERPTTEYLFDQEAVWLLQAHAFYGGALSVMPSKRNGYYYPAIRIIRDGKRVAINADRLIAGCSPYQDARLASKEYHDHTRGNIKPTHEQEVARQVGRENERSTGKVTRADAIAASCQRWCVSQLFPTAGAYTDALSHVYAVLEQRHPLAQPVDGFAGGDI